MVAIKNLVFLAATAAAVAIPRDATTVQNDLKKITSDTNALTAAVKSWDGSIGGAIPIQNDESTVDNDIKSTTSDANASSTVTDAQASAIISYINNTLEPAVNSALNALIAAKSKFASAGLTNTVESDLKTLKSDTDSLGSALEAKAPADQQNSAKAALAKIDQLFSNAIAQF